MSVDIARLQIEVESLKVRQAADDLDRLKRSGAGAAKETGGLKGIFASFGPLLATMGIGLLAKQFLSVNVEAQRLQTSLFTVEGSGKAAAVAFAALEKFAVETPFQLDEVTQAYISLKARGLDATMPAMAAYGDLAGAMGINIKDAVDGTSQALIGNLERVRGWGFTIIQQGDKVKISLGQTTMTVKKNSADMQAAFLAISKAEFGGAAARQAKTLGGAISNLEDGWDALLRTIGSGSGDLLAAPVRQLTEWLGEARTKMIEISQERTFQELIIVVGDTAKEVGVLTGELSSLLGTTAEAGVSTGAFVRILQGLRMVVLGIRSAYQGMGLLFLREVEAMAGGMIRFADAAMSMPRLSKLLGFDKAELAAGREFFRNVESWANESGGKLAGNFEDATERMLSDFESLSDRAKQRVDDVKKAIAEAEGDQSGVGKKKEGDGKTAPSSAEMGKMKEAQNVLREFGLETLKNLGLIDEWAAKEANLLEKIKPLGPIMAARVRVMMEELRATEELNKENEFRISMEARRAAVQASVEEADRRSAEGIVNMADPMREYRLQLQNINQLLEDNLINETQARLARAESAAGINADALSPAAKEAIDREKLNAQLAAGAIHISTYTARMRELTLNSTSGAGEIARAMEAAGSSMTQAFVNFVTTGKASFKDLVASILADLARMYAQKVMVQFLGMAIDWMTSGSGSTGNASGGAEPDYSYFSGRATGGSVAGGTPYLVGERGPEIFVPGAAGSIAPNSSLGGGGSIQITMVNNFYSDGSKDSKTTGDKKDGQRISESLNGLMDQWAVRNMRPNGLLNPGRA